MKQHKNCSL